MLIYIGFILAVAFFFLVLKWWSDGIYDTSESFLIAVLGCGLIFGFFAAQNLFQFVLTAIALAAFISYWIYQWNDNRWVTYYKRQISDCIRAVTIDPKNVAAREYLAESYYHIGNIEQAITEMQAAVDLGAGHNTKFKLRKWQNEYAAKISNKHVCINCGTENELNHRTCSNCGRELPVLSDFAKWLKGKKESRARVILTMAFGIAVACASFYILSPLYAVLVLMLICMGFAGYILLSSKSP
ncbi:MAG: zinc-ribbon domain-containing protein [Armatimonadota bacterium]